MFAGTDAAAGLATFDPSNKASNIALSGGDYIATESTAGYGRTKARSLTGKTSGKWYVEATVNETGSENEWALSVCNSSVSMADGALGDANSTTYQSNSYVGANASYLGNYSTFTDGDVIGLFADLDNDRIAWSKNGTWQNSANLSTGSGMVDISFLTGTKYFVFQTFNSDPAQLGKATLNPAATPPSGASLWS
jgi:hypothetical protein